MGNAHRPDGNIAGRESATETILAASVLLRSSSFGGCSIPQLRVARAELAKGEKFADVSFIGRYRSFRQSDLTEWQTPPGARPYSGALEAGFLDAGDSS